MRCLKHYGSIKARWLAMFADEHMVNGNPERFALELPTKSRMKCIKMQAMLP